MPAGWPGLETSGVPTRVEILVNVGLGLVQVPKSQVGQLMKQREDVDIHAIPTAGKTNHRSTIVKLRHRSVEFRRAERQLRYEHDTAIG